MQSIKGTSDFKHYLISQGINLIWLIIIWPICFFVLLSSNSQTAMLDSFFFIILYIIFAILMYYIFWKPDINCQPFLIVLGIIGLVGGIIWISLFFGIFNPYFKYEYSKASNCQLKTFIAGDLDGNEKYAALTIEFQLPNSEQKYTGQACASTMKKSNLAKQPYNYAFYKKNESVGCGSLDGTGTQLLNKTDFNSPYYTRIGNNNNQLRFLKTGGRSGSRSRSRSGSRRTRKNRNRSTSSSSSCSWNYNMTEIKMPAWKCQEYNTFTSQIAQASESPVSYKTCYFSIYGDKNKAKQNALDPQKKVEDMQDFCMIIFEDFPYYDKTAFILCILFCFFPFIMLTHFSWIPYLANKIKESLDNNPKITQVMNISNNDDNNNNEVGVSPIKEKSIERPVIQYQNNNNDIYYQQQQMGYGQQYPLNSNQQEYAKNQDINQQNNDNNVNYYYNNNFTQQQQNQQQIIGEPMM